MTNSPDSESSKVCPGHCAENFEPDHGCTVQCTADTSRSTAEGEAPDHQGREACLVSLTPTGLVDLLWNSLAQSSHSVVTLPPSPPSHTALKLHYFYLETNRMAEKTPPPHSWGWAGNVGQA